MSTRLETRSADLSQLIEAADPEPQRHIAVKAALAALAAFRRARAVSALAFALDADPRNAALEAAYEAEAATENLELIRGIVNEVLAG